TRLMALMLVLVGVASLGPSIRIDGRTAVTGPWVAFVHLPLVKYVLPARLMMYAALLTGLAMALWLAGARGTAARRGARWVGGGRERCAERPEGTLGGPVRGHRPPTPVGRRGHAVSGAAPPPAGSRGWPLSRVTPSSRRRTHATRHATRTAARKTRAS